MLTVTVNGEDFIGAMHYGAAAADEAAYLHLLFSFFLFDYLLKRRKFD